VRAPAHPGYPGSKSHKMVVHSALRLTITFAMLLQGVYLCVLIIDNRILKYLDIRPPINQPYKILPTEVELGHHFDLNITQWVTTCSVG